MQIPICLSLILPAPTPINTIVANWFNQSYNAVINYGNRNASSTYTTSDILKSYTFATASSVFVALGIRKSVEHKTKTMTGAKLLLYNSGSAMVASAVAGFLNTWFMRQVEMK
jgi:sideroflexin-5